MLTFSAGENFSNSVLEIEVNGAGTAGTDYDQIVVNGTATLGGTSTLNLSVNFTPSGNQEIIILNATALSGAFTTVTGLPSGWTLLYNTPSNGKVTMSYTILPIELLYFKGKAEGPVNELQWATASEQNSQYHIVERSADGSKGWQEIGRATAAGNTTELQTYRLTDEQPLPLGYYRLKAVDFDGQYEYSPVVVIERGMKGFVITNVFPVPVADELTLRMTLAEPASLSIDIADLNGRTLLTFEPQLEAGLRDVQLDVSQLTAGIYFIQVNNGKMSWSERIMKQ
jgi:hypothetical protein